MFDYKGYQVEPYTGLIYTKTGKEKVVTKCGRNGRYYKISTGVSSSATVQRVIVCAYYGISTLKGYFVHHIDKDPHNNMITNLVVVDSETHHYLHKLDGSQYMKACHDLKKSERLRLKEWGLLK